MRMAIMSAKSATAKEDHVTWHSQRSPQQVCEGTLLLGEVSEKHAVPDQLGIGSRRNRHRRRKG